MTFKVIFWQVTVPFKTQVNPKTTFSIILGGLLRHL